MTYKNIGRMGRFANALFQIAGTIGIAVRSGQPYSFPLYVNHDAKERFGTTEDINVYKYFINPLPVLPGDLNFSDYDYFWGYRDIQLTSGNWNFNSHFQSERYFSHCIDLIRHYFTMEHEIDIDGCCVHMRFGDYSRDPDGYHPCPSTEYYREALTHIPKGTQIFLFSDDPDEAVKKMNPITKNYMLMDMDYIDSFRMMKRCKHFVTANSSYSLMAAILSEYKDKVVVCPKNWFGPTVGLETADLYPYNSIVI